MYALFTLSRSELQTAIYHAYSSDVALFLLMLIVSKQLRFPQQISEHNRMHRWVTQRKAVWHAAVAVNQLLKASSLPDKRLSPNLHVPVNTSLCSSR